MGGQKGPKWKREAVPDHKVSPAVVPPVDRTNAVSASLTLSTPVTTTPNPLESGCSMCSIVIWPPTVAERCGDQVPMGLYSRYQVLPRLHLRYIHRYNHVNISRLGEQNFHGLSGPERLRCHPLPGRKVVVRRVHYLLLPPGTHHIPHVEQHHLMESSWHTRLERPRRL